MNHTGAIAHFTGNPASILNLSKPVGGVTVPQCVSLPFHWPYCRNVFLRVAFNGSSLCNTLLPLVEQDRTLTPDPARLVRKRLQPFNSIVRQRNDSTTGCFRLARSHGDVFSHQVDI